VGRNASRVVTRTVLIYTLVAGAWILLSDVLLGALAPSSVVMSAVAILKGWIFVGVTATLLYFALRSQLRRLDDRNEAHQRSELARVQANERLSLTARAANVALWDADLRGNSVTFSPEWKRQIGFEDHEIADDFEEWRSRIHPEDRERALGAVQEFLAHPTPTYQLEFRLRHKDGSYRWVLSQAVLQRDETGDPLRVVGCHIDITERKGVEQALRQNETNLNRAQRVAQVGSWHLDILRNVLTWSAETHRIFGIPDGTPLTYECFLDCVHPGDRAAVDGAWKAALAGGSYDIEHRIVVGDAVRWVREQAEFEFDAGGRLLGGIGTAQDVTERRIAEERLRLQSAALQSAASVIVITDREGTIQWVNRAFTRMTGYTAAEAIGRNPRLLKSGKQDERLYTELWESIVAGRVWQGELINRRKDGKLFTEEVTITPVRNEKGEIAHFVAIKQDITTRKALEEQLRQAQKMEAIGQLAGGVAHDFNNLLTVIEGHTILLQGLESLDARSQDSVHEIQRSVARAANLTRQLLAFSRRQTMQPRDLDLNEVVASTTKMLQRVLGEDINMQYNYAPHPLNVHADAGMLDQVLLNLAVNARDAMPRGGRLVIETSAVEIEESSEGQEQGMKRGPFVCLSVSDNGSGIEKEVLPRIFEPFFTTKPLGKGTGLGLATVYGIVDQHHGWIDVSSMAGEGTTFRIHLPRVNRPAEVTHDRTLLRSVKGGMETILLVEDDPSLRKLVSEVLVGCGYRVVVAETGVAALEVWRRDRGGFDLLLTDLVMPGGLTGLELAAHILEESPSLPVVYTSGYSAEIAGRDFPLQEGVDFLAKPFSPQRLAQVVRERLDARIAQPVASS
jgi:two-component system cell cycle sensor histidine kinase/response regulator CckA